MNVSTQYEVVNTVSRDEINASKVDILALNIQRVREHIAEEMAEYHDNAGPPIVWVEPDEDYLKIRAVFPILAEGGELSLDDWLEKQRRRIVNAGGMIPR